MTLNRREAPSDTKQSHNESPTVKLRGDPRMRKSDLMRLSHNTSPVTAVRRATACHCRALLVDCWSFIV